jgi:hypothetical protein
MNPDEWYDLVLEATRQALREELGGPSSPLVRRLTDGIVTVRDGEGKLVKEVPVAALLGKVTAVREKLRVLEQKLNNHPSLDEGEKADLQDYLTRCYGSLTTFNFLFRDDADKFVGTGGR